MYCKSCKLQVNGTRGHRYEIRVERPGASWIADTFCHLQSAIGTVKKALLQWDPTTELSVIDTQTKETIFFGRGSW